MSGFYVLALLAIWALLTKWLWKGGRRLLDSEFGNRGVRVALVAAVAVFWLGGTFWEVAGKKMYWDARVRKLCAIDGGVKVYETVVLPPEKFNRWGQPNFYHPNQGENALGAEYLFRSEEKFYRNDNPTFVRYHHEVIRRIDNKKIGETTSYGRGGGDIPGPWESSDFHCPPTSESSELALFKKIFLQSDME